MSVLLKKAINEQILDAMMLYDSLAIDSDDLETMNELVRYELKEVLYDLVEKRLHEYKMMVELDVIDEDDLF